MRAALFFLCVSTFPIAYSAAAAEGPAAEDFCAEEVAAFGDLEGLPAQLPRRVVCADVAALDQMLVYNRFGSHDPFGMIFALTRDVVPATDPLANCAEDVGVRGRRGALVAGEVRLRDCKRPRPLTLRANVGDVLHVRVHNLLRPSDGAGGRPGYSETFCRQADAVPGTARRIVREAVSEGTSAGAEGAIYREAGDRLVEAMCAAGTTGEESRLDAAATDWPLTRGISFVIDGLRPLPDPATGKVDDVCLGLGQLAPGGDPVDCFWHAEREGPYFINSIAAAAGGEGDGGSLTHGLFGSLAVEPQPVGENGEMLAPTEWYRSQVTQNVFNIAWKNREGGAPHARDGNLTYDAPLPEPVDGEAGLPILNLLKKVGEGRFEIVHNDLNAIIQPPDRPAFREFTVVFHDELKTFATANFEELDRFPQLKGVRDGFGINYGSSGLGALILANRKGIGPAADCAECLYEEFFLESWANGDPALLEAFADDPSNVHHSYLNDPVVFRNYHAGPKETHVFHLHAHQWLGGNDIGRGAYLDSQTVAPRQGFTYNIYDGGLRRYRPGDMTETEDWWETMGSGNRNRTVGDSIFHCHLYPHFAQGMWELWRVHDVLEDGSRRLPDGQPTPGLSTEIAAPGGTPRGGTVGPNGEYVADAAGTPVPGLVPLPDLAAPLLPTYRADGDTVEPVPGYPFFIAGKPGHRAPQPPLDMAVENGEPLDGGLPRHVVAGGSERRLGIEDGGPAPAATTSDDLYRLTAKMLALGDFSGHLTKANIDVLDPGGETLEKAAMAFHHDGEGLKLRDAQGGTAVYLPAAGGYAPEGATGAQVFAVNGAPPKPGAPFADPCGAPDGYDGHALGYPGGPESQGPLAARDDPFVPGARFVPDPALTGFRRYAASAVQVDLVTNKAGWHDPQGRINVLTAKSDDYKNLGPSADEEPFFFRAYSGECIEFRHTNELPKELELDDFQVKTPTDVIGQHIHLVKFDVTSADGSGNGWNYEDGTFAPDEIATRLCAMLDPAQATPTVGGGSRVPAGSTVDKMDTAAWSDLCAREGEGAEAHWVPKAKDWWSRKLSDNRGRFQTTVQRWFADPILSVESDRGEAAGRQDRTLRTVFTHDHFGPSSIQQHGFYSALVIEPADKKVCPGDKNGAAPPCLEPSTTPLAEGGPEGVGVHKVVTGGDTATHPDYREFALAIADFALLYDPTDGSKADAAAAAGALPGGETLPGPAARAADDPDPKDAAFGRPKGLATLVCEAQRRGLAGGVADIEETCGAKVETETVAGATKIIEGADVPPAVVASALITDDEVSDLRQHFAFVRMRAGLGNGMARPVNAPDRPEAISADHHDPYLVNYRGEPVPLRIGDTGGDAPKTAFDCFDAITVGEKVPDPGKHLDDAEKAKLTADAVAAPVPDCSIWAQSADPRGNLANVYRSSFGDDLQPAAAPVAEPPAAAQDEADPSLLRNRAHGDPETPLFEIYSGERAQFRLIQGAQEVQHTFTIEGMGWRRQVDQRYPADGQPLGSDHAGKTLWQECRDRGRRGVAYQHDDWRNGRLPVWDASTTDQRLIYWHEHTADVARCDNLEAIVSAQEVGISEHFEIDSAPSGDSPQTRFVGGDANALDYLYDFGSQDAIWNGAWGLMRVYDKPDTIDAMASLAAGRQVPMSDRLAPVLSPEEQGRREIGEADRSGLTCPLGAPGIEVWAVAMPLAGGQKYASWGNRLRDMDGLALVHVPGAKARDWMSKGWLTGEGATLTVPAARIPALRAEAAAYFRDEPMVIRGNAGDCLSLNIINALAPAPADPTFCGGPNGVPGPMRDCLGDAPLPRIVRLNVEPTWTARAEGETGPRRPEQLDRIDVRPSARIAFTSTLSMMTQGGKARLPFGMNATTSAPPGGVQRTDYYLGLLRLEWKRIEDRLRETTTDGSRNAVLDACVADGTLTAPTDAAGQTARDAMSGVGGRRVNFSGGAVPASPVHFQIDVLGSAYHFTVTQLLQLGEAERAAILAALASDAGTCVDAMIEREHLISAIPYAFGAVPLKPVADLFNQLPHGLFGAIVVEPKDASYPGRTRTGYEPAPPHAPTNAHLGRGANTLITLPADGQEPARSLREFVLFYQDGMNLWDMGSGNRWIPLADPKAGLPIVDDCGVCDDSYDLGEKAVSYRAPAFSARLREMLGRQVEQHDDLNDVEFPGDFRALKDSVSVNPLRLWALPGEEVMVRVVHPGGRARQRAFVTVGNDYDDQFPGFGFPHAALLAPGKAITAAFSAPVRPGCYIWSDGPREIEASGSWGLLDVLTKGGDSSCRFRP